MTSCPDDRELLEMVDGEVDDCRAAAIVDHLIECEDCRLSIGRSEAALTYALGGLADTGRWTPPVQAESGEPERSEAEPLTALPAAPESESPELATSTPGAPTLTTGGRRPWLVPAALLAAAATVIFALASLTRDAPDREPPDTRIETAVSEPSAGSELQRLIARAEALRDAATTAPDGRELVAAGALAAAEARVWTVGRHAARARVRDVIDRFPGTSAAREARALLASSEWEDKR